MSGRGCFITGTDTGIGKTIVAAALLRALAGAGVTALGMKPVAAGADQTSSGWRNDDALELAAAASLPMPYDDINPYCFPDPVSPHLAARAAGAEIDFRVIESAYARLAASAGPSGCVVVEGAGGWLAPLSNSTTIADLAMSLWLPVIVVVGLRLGCLNHAQLTVDAIRSRGVEFAGWIANRIDPEFQLPDENLATLAASIGQPALDVIDFDPRIPRRAAIAPTAMRALSSICGLSI